MRAAGDALGEIDDRRAADYLMSEFHGKNWELIAADGAFFIRKGERGSEDTLIEALREDRQQESRRGHAQLRQFEIERGGKRLGVEKRLQHHLYAGGEKRGMGQQVASARSGLSRQRRTQPGGAIRHCPPVSSAAVYSLLTMPIETEIKFRVDDLAGLTQPS